jgi:hypothetical protein
MWVGFNSIRGLTQPRNGAVAVPNTDLFTFPVYWIKTAVQVPTILPLQEKKVKRYKTSQETTIYLLYY